MRNLKKNMQRVPFPENVGACNTFTWFCSWKRVICITIFIRILLLLRMGWGRRSSLPRFLFLGWFDKPVRLADWNQEISGQKPTQGYHNHLRRLPEKSYNSKTSVRPSRAISLRTAGGELGRRNPWLAHAKRHAQIRSTSSVQQQWSERFSLHEVQHVALCKRESLWKRRAKQKGTPSPLVN